MDSLVNPRNPALPSLNAFMCCRHSPRLQGSSYKTLACPYQSTHVPHKKEEWKLGSKREYPGTEWNTPNFSCGTREIFFWNIHLEFSVLRQKAFHFVPTAKSRVFDWGEPRLMYQENACTSQAFCCRTHTSDTLIWLPSGIHFLQREGMGNVLLGSITLCWKKNGILLECFPRECCSCVPCVFQTPVEKKSNGWRLAEGWNWVVNLHFKDCDLCWSNYLFTWKSKAGLLMELPQQTHKLRKAYRFTMVQC